MLIRVQNAIKYEEQEKKVWHFVVWYDTRYEVTKKRENEKREINENMKKGEINGLSRRYL